MSEKLPDSPSTLLGLETNPMPPFRQEVWRAILYGTGPTLVPLVAERVFAPVFAATGSQVRAQVEAQLMEELME